MVKLLMVIFAVFIFSYLLLQLVPSIKDVWRSLDKKKFFLSLFGYIGILLVVGFSVITAVHIF